MPGHKFAVVLLCTEAYALGRTTTRDGNGKEIEKWISENIRDIRICIRANPIHFHPKGWKLEGNTNVVIRDIRIRICANPIRFHP